MTRSKNGTPARTQAGRSRWAAIGAAVAVVLGGGGLFVVDAASGPPSAIVTIEPVRILDTRDPLDVGLAGPFVSPIAQDLLVTGPIPTTTGTQTVVPPGATGVVLNVTAFNPSANGFVSVRPADAGGAPTTSNLNVLTGETVPNAVTVQLPTAGPDAGKIEISYDALGVVGPTSEIFIDVVAYLQAGAAGPQGETGPPGPSIGGVEYASTPEILGFIGSTYTVVESVTITAPQAGSVVVTGSVGLAGSAGASARCVVADTTNPAPSAGSAISLNDFDQFAETKGFAVRGAGDATYWLLCRAEVGTISAANRSMTAVYSPNRL